MISTTITNVTNTGHSSETEPPADAAATELIADRVETAMRLARAALHLLREKGEVTQLDDVWLDRELRAPHRIADRLFRATDSR